MINPVSSGSTIPAAVQRAAPQPKPQQDSSSTPQDTVQLSSKAQAHASGDVDHDGDSH
jgi:hypothetical protein